MLQILQEFNLEWHVLFEIQTWTARQAEMEISWRTYLI